MKKIAEHPLKRQILREYSGMRKENEKKLVENLKHQGILFGETGVSHERLGALLQTRTFFDLTSTSEEDLVRGDHASYCSGEQAPFYYSSHEHHDGTGEGNLSLAIGQFFGVVYPNRTRGTEQYFNNSDSMLLLKEIELDEPYPFDVYVKSYANVYIPDSVEKVHMAERGNAISDFCGATLDVHTSVGYFTNRIEDRETKHSPWFQMLNSIRSEGNDQTDFHPTAAGLQAHMRIPAGTRNLCFGIHILANVFSSRDFSQLPADCSLNGFSFIDLRDRITGNQWPLMRNTLQGTEKRPEGGVLGFVRLDIYAIENTLSI